MSRAEGWRYRRQILFKAKRDDGSSEKFDICRLDEAWVDDRNQVELVDGRHLHSVDLIPTVGVER